MGATSSKQRRSHKHYESKENNEKKEIIERKQNTSGNDTVRIKSVQNLRAVFDEIDEDNSGYLDIAELGTFLKKTTGKAPSANTLVHMINEVDQNGDGQVSFDEMLLFYQSIQVPEITKLVKSEVKLDGYFKPTTFLVIPSTGNVGFLVAQALGKVPSFTVKCGIRKTSNKGIVKLVEELEGCQTVEVYNKLIPSLTAAMEGVDKVLAYMPTLAVSQWANDIANIMTAAKTANVGCVYWITGDNSCLTQDGALVTAQNSALECAKMIDVPLVVIKPNNLASNLYAHRETIMKELAIYIGYKSYVKTVITDPVDVAQLTCTVMSQPIESHAGKSYYVTGPTSITFDEIVGKFVEKIQAEELQGRGRVANHLTLVEIFQEADTDCNGYLSLAELTSLLQKIDIPADKVAAIFKEADTDGDQQLSCDEFVESIGKFYDRKNTDPPEPIRIYRLKEKDFRGYLAGMGVLQADIECIVSLYADFDSGKVGGANAVKTEDFERIVGRKPNSFDDWLETNVGAFMSSHWDTVFVHARKDLMIKSAFQ